LKGALTCNLKLSEHYVMDKKTKVRFDTASHCLGGHLDCVHVGVWGPTKTVSLGGHRYCLFCWWLISALLGIPYKTKI